MKHGHAHNDGLGEEGWRWIGKRRLKLLVVKGEKKKR